MRSCIPQKHPPARIALPTAPLIASSLLQMASSLIVSPRVQRTSVSRPDWTHIGPTLSFGRGGPCRRRHLAPRRASAAPLHETPLGRARSSASATHFALPASPRVTPEGRHSSAPAFHAATPPPHEHRPSLWTHTLVEMNPARADTRC